MIDYALNMTKQRKTCSISEVMAPERANFSGNIHGGYIMMMMDRVAYACAARYCQKNVVTISVDQVVFKQPIYVGELVTFLAHVNYAGRTSMEIGIKIMAEDLHTGEVRHTNTSFITMVAVDDNSKPTRVPELVIESDECKRRYDEANLRRKINRELQQRYDEISKPDHDTPATS